ncbi:cystathionine beta-lyase chloroplastic-like, partial [Trifolium pratense]
MVSSSSISLKPFTNSVSISNPTQSTLSGKNWDSLVFSKSANFRTNKLSCRVDNDGFKLSCSVDREMDVRTSALVDDDFAECLSEVELREPSISTMVMNFENKFDPYGAVSAPLYQTATFKQPSAIENGPYDYTRSGNPTRDALESILAKLDKADRAFCFTSGMAALTAVVHLLKSGEEILAADDLYGGADRLLSQVVPRSGVLVKRVNTSDLNEVASAIGSKTKLVWLESPTNPRIQISDIR